MFDQGLRRRRRPTAVRHGVSRTWMRDLRILHEQTVQSLARSCLGVAAHADDGADTECLDDDPQELVTFLVHRRHDLVREFLGDDVTTLLGVLEEQERTIVMDEVLGEEGLGRPETFLAEPPQAATTDLRTMTGEAGHLLARVLLLRTSDRHLQPHPVPDGGDLPERHAGLGHPERTRIHAQEEHLLRPRSRIASQIGLMRSPGVVQRLVDEVRRRGKGAAGQSLP
ncbi:MAG: hypothetical protein RL639_703 [Verrucomicrobiota bacterium]